MGFIAWSKDQSLFHVKRYFYGLKIKANLKKRKEIWSTSI